MRRALIIALSIIGLLLTGGAIIGIDVYMSYQDYQENEDAFEISEPTFVLSESKLSAEITVFVDTPPLGYIPKAADVEIIIMRESVQHGDPISFRIKLGETVRVDFTVTISQTDVDKLNLGISLFFDIQIKATPVYLGIPITSLTQEFDEFSLRIHE